MSESSSDHQRPRDGYRESYGSPTRIRSNFEKYGGHKTERVLGSSTRVMSSIEVARGGSLRKGYATKGIVRATAFETDDVLFARSVITAGNVSDWHHHGTRHLYGYMVSGSLRFDYVKAKIESVEVHPGDFFHIPVGLVHRDVNPDQTTEAVVVNILLGKGPPLVNVPDP